MSDSRSSELKGKKLGDIICSWQRDFVSTSFKLRLRSLNEFLSKTETKRKREVIKHSRRNYGTERQRELRERETWKSIVCCIVSFFIILSFILTSRLSLLSSWDEGVTSFSSQKICQATQRFGCQVTENKSLLILTPWVLTRNWLTSKTGFLIDLSSKNFLLWIQV